MKKYISLVLVLVLALTCLTACGGQTAEKTDKNGNGPQIVTTIFPIYSWVKGVLGDNPSNAEVTMLLDKGVDLHSYQPTAEDIRKVAGCDMFIYVGGESDEWVEDVLKEASNKDMIVINLMDVIGDQAKEEEVKEGMQAEELVGGGHKACRPGTEERGGRSGSHEPLCDHGVF
ncbi:metal ABC transporter substrate-binding protein [Eubacterium sp. AB3007]|uniref:metal ABC transporter substrate-binding protein n=1 Tax=Eubacterium sp. AB3007 TaxID=1392487 RepID=UPI000690A9DE